ncbi:MAG: hypothetical protein JNK77_20790 [Saprospiraceae bacterium]|nr:hypothetical protein [Saprospiraceae bacterium]
MHDQISSMDPQQTRVWIYQANNPFPEQDLPQIRRQISDFAQQWISHNRLLRAAGDVLHDRFVVLMADESQVDAGGCSIDRSVAFLKGLQAAYGVDLFDRMRFSFLDSEGGVQTVDRQTFSALYANGTINDETPVFDTLVATKADFDQAFVKPLAKSWHKRMV